MSIGKIWIPETQRGAEGQVPGSAGEPERSSKEKQGGRRENRGRGITNRYRTGWIFRGGLQLGNHRSAGLAKSYGRKWRNRAAHLLKEQAKTSGKCRFPPYSRHSSTAGDDGSCARRTAKGSHGGGILRDTRFRSNCWGRAKYSIYPSGRFQKTRPEHQVVRRFLVVGSPSPLEGGSREWFGVVSLREQSKA